MTTKENVKHTPGPWDYDGGRDIVSHGGQYPQDNYIGKAYDREDGAGFANARLIAAAPSLLTTARALLRSLEPLTIEGKSGDYYNFDIARDALREAIEGAEGAAATSKEEQA